MDSSKNIGIIWEIFPICHFKMICYLLGLVKDQCFKPLGNDFIGC